ncbi:MAG: fused MFS/spermidine synthase [Verrucomicrobia bacterium]|nr:fused MFS/spermidine synthase [Verrucomicrobiota bacterium]MDA1067563.1 fused MFS/spermidine synthase [Verrucomicrobiota bacterium]
MRFYEIDSDVKTIAEIHFAYLKNSKAELEYSIGDARTSLENEQPQNFDVLVLDAFSGDAIPVHLLTVEAFQLYLRHLNPDGILAIHVSNRHLDLKPVVMGLTKELEKFAVFVVNEDDDQFGAYSSDWILMTDNKPFVLDEDVLRSLTPFPAYKNLIVWTDDFSDLFSVIIR